MKALTWHGKHDIRCEACRTRKLKMAEMRSSKSLHAPSADQTFITSMA